MPNTRVLVVEDSKTVRERLCAIVEADPDLELVGEAADGGQAIDLCRSLRPGVVTMDMMLPVMTGLAATEYIMAHCPTPILVVSSSFNRGELFKTYDALAAGAVDVMEKPNGHEGSGVWEEQFLSKLKLVSRVRVITHPRGRLRAFERQPSDTHPQKSASPDPAREIRVAAIGASTGGPNAILRVLQGLPSDFALPVLLVLHIGGQFGSMFADWLDGQAARPVSLARDGDPVVAAAGRIVMAPPDQHLLVDRGRLRLTNDPERHSCRPSVDVLFESIAREYGASAMACLLTGMGRDGAQGLLAMRNAGAITIAQDEASSIVYGMPREAALLGAAGSILPLDEIGPAFARSVLGGRA